jgi:hypothetical protein
LPAFCCPSNAGYVVQFVACSCSAYAHCVAVVAAAAAVVVGMGAAAAAVPLWGPSSWRHRRVWGFTGGQQLLCWRLCLLCVVRERANDVDAAAAAAIAAAAAAAIAAMLVCVWGGAATAATGGHGG